MKSVPFRPLLVTLVLGAALSTSSLRAADAKAALPKLVDLGAGKCVPCKMMKPILGELAKEYAGQFEVVFIDVWENHEAGAQYKIRLIPTQIFYAADGRELARHEGFMAKADILAKWKELGVGLKAPTAPEGN